MHEACRVTSDANTLFVWWDIANSSRQPSSNCPCGAVSCSLPLPADRLYFRFLNRGALLHYFSNYAISDHFGPIFRRAFCVFLLVDNGGPRHNHILRFLTIFSGFYFSISSKWALRSSCCELKRLPKADGSMPLLSSRARNRCSSSFEYRSAIFLHDLASNLGWAVSAVKGKVANAVPVREVPPE